MADVIPLFPLSHVLLPGMPLPLHIFEQRYRDLVDDISAGPGTPSFGVVALRTGTEARTRHVLDGGPDVEEVGTVAEVVDRERSADGTSDLLCVGSRRFRIQRVITENDEGTDYLRAEVEFLPEADGELTLAQEQRARDLIGVYDAVLVRLAGRTTGEETLPRDATQLSYQVAARLPLSPQDRQSLLADADTGTRLARVAQLLRRELALLRGTRSIAVSPAVLRIATGIN